MYTQFSMLNLQSSETVDILCLNFFLSEERKAEDKNTQKKQVAEFTLFYIFHIYVVIYEVMFLCERQNDWLSSSHLVLECILFYTLFT